MNVILANRESENNCFMSKISSLSKRDFKKAIMELSVEQINSLSSAKCEFLIKLCERYGITKPLTQLRIVVNKTKTKRLAVLSPELKESLSLEGMLDFVSELNLDNTL